MKKILILILLGVITILTPLSFKANYYSIDQPVIDLNNHTLNEVFTDTINELVQYKITSILDLPAYEGLSLRDIFETNNLITNGDFELDSNANGLADNFIQFDTTGLSNVNGIQSFTATAQYGRIGHAYSIVNTHQYYLNAKLKVLLSNEVGIAIMYGGGGGILATSSNDFQIISGIRTATVDTTTYFGVVDYRTSGWTQIDIDYLYVLDLAIFTTAPSQLQLDEWLGFYLDPSTIASFDMVGDIEVYKAGTSFYNLTAMKTDQVYSTFNLDTFDNLTDGEITDQFGAWQTLGIEDIEVLSLTEFQTFAPALDQEDMLYWYNYYNLILEYDEVQAGILSDLEITILIIALVLFVIGIALAIYFHHKIMFFVTGLLWFVPIVIVPNIFIITFSVIMIIIFGLLAFYNSQGKDFD